MMISTEQGAKSSQAAPAMEPRQHERRPMPRAETQLAFARVATALAAVAAGALAIGALAIGSLAIRRLVIAKSRVLKLRVDELDIGKLRVHSVTGQGGTSRSRLARLVAREAGRDARRSIAVGRP